MNRNYNITCNNYIKNSINHKNVDISKLDEIINHSAQSIYCSCLNYIEYGAIDSIIQNLQNKIMPSGLITFSILDMKKVAEDFIKGIVSGEETLLKINNFKSIFGTEDLYQRFDGNKFKINQVVKNNNLIEISAERVQI